MKKIIAILVLFSSSCLALVNSPTVTVANQNLVECLDGAFGVLRCMDGNEKEQLKAFPTCEGFGCGSSGGRGGDLYVVTNLNDSGAGSFREAMEAAGTRTITFAVSGIINLLSDVRVLNGGLYIAGQTSPSGVLITGARTIFQAPDITVRHMRFAVGKHRANGSPNILETLDSVNIYGSAEGHSPGVDRLVLDHVSMRWGVDETLSTYYGATNVTVQWSTVSEALSNVGHPDGEHSKGALIAGKSMDKHSNISFHHNYMAHNGSRNPETGGNSNGFELMVDIVNNVTYNPNGSSSGMQYGNGRVNWRGNYTKVGPDSNDFIFPVRMYEYEAVEQNIYEQRNMSIGAHSNDLEANADDNTWRVGMGYSGLLAPSTWRKLTPWPTIGADVTYTPMTDAYALHIVQNAGATVPVRDADDQRYIDDFINGTGAVGGMDGLIYPDSFPVFLDAAPPVDSDNDGMADAWETSRGFTVVGVDDRNLTNEIGYTFLDVYLNELADGGWVN